MQDQYLEGHAVLGIDNWLVPQLPASEKPGLRILVNYRYIDLNMELSKWDGPHMLVYEFIVSSFLSKL